MTPRPFYWSVRRELWENRSVFLAPLIAAGVVLFGFALSTFQLPQARRGVLALDPARRAAEVAMVYHVSAFAIILTGMLVAVFYCLGALHGERRDRSILFWKSLPVSDLTTVASKAAIPTIVIPAVVFGTIVAMHLTMLSLADAVLLANGVDIAAPGTQVPLIQMSLVLLYGLVVMALWYAPVWGWLLLVSGWAKRTTFLWAVLPLLAVCLVEWLAFHTSHFASMLGYRLGGGFSEAVTVRERAGGMRGFPPGIDLGDLDPVRFLTSPGLWAGLAFAAGFLAAAIWLRRRREPI